MNMQGGKAITMATTLMLEKMIRAIERTTWNHYKRDRAGCMLFTTIMMQLTRPPRPLAYIAADASPYCSLKVHVNCHVAIVSHPRDYLPISWFERHEVYMVPLGLNSASE